MKVLYNGKIVKNNDFLRVSETQIEPEIKLNVNPNKFYTLICYDPDAVGGTHIHLAKNNITSNDIKTGNTIIPYKGPAPPPKTGIHHYIFNLYEQVGVNNIEPINEIQMDLDNLQDILKVNSPIFETRFISQNESGGRKRKTKRRKTQRRKNKTRRY